MYNIEEKVIVWLTTFDFMSYKKAKFIVTPKEEKRLSVKDALLGSYDSILFAIIVGLLTYATYFSLAPTILMVLCCALTPLAILAANIPAGTKTAL